MCWPPNSISVSAIKMKIIRRVSVIRKNNIFLNMLSRRLNRQLQLANWNVHSSFGGGQVVAQLLSQN